VNKVRRMQLARPIRQWRRICIYVHMWFREIKANKQTKVTFYKYRDQKKAEIKRQKKNCFL